MTFVFDSSVTAFSCYTSSVFWLKIEELDLPVKRNQAFIIKYFSKTREKFCDHVLGEGQRETRMKLLQGVSFTLAFPLIVVLYDNP